MTNYEKTVKEMSRFWVAEDLWGRYCADNDCCRCPLGKECDGIANRLEEQSGEAPTEIQVIFEWLNEEAKTL